MSRGKGHLVGAAAEEGVSAADDALARVCARLAQVVVPHHLPPTQFATQFTTQFTTCEHENNQAFGMPKVGNCSKLCSKLLYCVHVVDCYVAAVNCAVNCYVGTPRRGRSAAPPAQQLKLIIEFENNDYIWKHKPFGVCQQMTIPEMAWVGAHTRREDDLEAPTQSHTSPGIQRIRRWRDGVVGVVGAALLYCTIENGKMTIQHASVVDAGANVSRGGDGVGGCTPPCP